MDWITASQLAGEIVDIVGVEKVTARQQEEIASLIYNRYGWKFNDHWQKWQRIERTNNERRNTPK